MAYSAKEPGATPITSSPGRNMVTSPPTASTVPPTSHPRTRSFGPRNPITGRAMYGCPVIRCHTSGPAPAACTRTSTSLSPTTGSSMSRSSSTSAEPYLSCTIAFIAPPPSWCYAAYLLAIPVTLYKHITNKDEMLDGMVDVVVGEIDPPLEGAD